MQTLSYLSEVDSIYLKKREELLLGSLAISYKEYVGTLGSTLKSEMSKLYSNTGNLCICYDAVSVIKEAIILMISKGIDFEDPFALENAMRNNKITGCIGSISFETGSNSIKSAEFMIRQLTKNDKTQK